MTENIEEKPEPVISREEGKFIAENAENFSIQTRGMLDRMRRDGMTLQDVFDDVKKQVAANPDDPDNPNHLMIFGKARDFIEHNAERLKIPTELIHPNPTEK